MSFSMIVGRYEIVATSGVENGSVRVGKSEAEAYDVIDRKRRRSMPDWRNKASHWTLHGFIAFADRRPRKVYLCCTEHTTKTKPRPLVGFCFCACSYQYLNRTLYRKAHRNTKKVTLRTGTRMPIAQRHPNERSNAKRFAEPTLGQMYGNEHEEEERHRDQPAARDKGQGHKFSVHRWLPSSSGR